VVDIGHGGDSNFMDLSEKLDELDKKLDKKLVGE